MKRILLSLVATLALVACGEESSDTLTRKNNPINDPGATAGGPDSTYDHTNDPAAQVPGAENQPPVDPVAVRLVGSPEVTSRLHSCQKMSVDSVRQLLDSRGLTGGGQRPDGMPSAQQILESSTSALGAANYDGRVPEAAFASTSATSKLFDIFSMAAYDAVADDWNAPACPNVKMFDANKKFTKDGITCLIGRPATDAHVTLANSAIDEDPADGAKIAIAALLAAAHTCQ